MKTALIGCVFGVSTFALAAPTAYLPIDMDTHLQLQIDRLFAITQGNPMRKPYAINQIEAALGQIQYTDPSLHQYIRRQLDRYNGAKRISRLGIKANLSSKNHQPIANQRGLSSREHIQSIFESVWRPKSYILVQSGMDYRANSADLVPFNTFVAFSKNKFQLDIGYKEHWYSPFKFSSQLISSNAEMEPALSLSSIKPFERWWQLNFDLFYSRLDRVKKGIRYSGEWHDGSPHLLGMHVNIEPIQGWKLGFNRLFQFGGGPRKVSMGDILQGFVDPASKDNSFSKAEKDSELGDQLASINTSYRFNTDLPVEIYAELAAEDTQGQRNLSFGNQATGFGVFLPNINDNITFRYEYNRFKTSWYTNHSYSFGNTNGGNVFGHYAGDQRKFGHGVPAEIHKAVLNIFNSAETSWGLSLSSINNKDKSLYKKSHEFQLENRFKWRDYPIETRLTVGNSVFAIRYTHFSSVIYW